MRTFFMFRTNSMARCQGWQGAYMFRTNSRFLLHAKPAFPTSMWVVWRGAKGNFLLLQKLHFHHPWWSWQGAYMFRPNSRFLLHAKPAFPTSMWLYGAVPRTFFCSCKNCISTIHGGHGKERICSGRAAGF
jgi:hypothetical protein